MSQFISVIRHEFFLSIRRPGFWIAYVMIGLFFLITLVIPSPEGESGVIPSDMVWSEAGLKVFTFNIFMPLLAGILAADRLQRDFQTSIRELQRSTPFTIPVYLLSKYLGVLLSVLVPMLILVIVSGTFLVAAGFAPLSIFWPLSLAFFSIAVPAHAFVVAFSLACPLVMPLRVYQVLFTGYWFWGNLLNPMAFPSISDSVLNAVGQYPLQAYFSSYIGSTHAVVEGFTPLQAVANLIVLLTCIALVLFSTDRYLRYQERKA